MKDLRKVSLVVGNSVAFTDKNRIKTGKLRSIGARGMCVVEPHGQGKHTKTVNRQAKNLLDISPKVDTITETVTKIEHVKGDTVEVQTPTTKVCWAVFALGIIGIATAVYAYLVLV